MRNSTKKTDNFFKLACYFEGSLILVAIVLGWFADIDPFKDFIFSERAVIFGLIGTVPLYLTFSALYQIKIDSLQQIKQLLLETLGPSLYQFQWSDLLILATIAGISEELLFRGLLQPWMEASWGMTAGLIGSSLIFGLLHAVTPMYAILAALVSVYLGLSLDYGGERNLLTPIIIHGVYDFLAFLTIIRGYRSQLSYSKTEDKDQ